MSRMVFQNLGGVDQLLITSPEDFEQVLTLDRARWAATSVPVSQFYCDPAFLAYMDTDKNQRVRADEVCDAQRWLWARLRDRSRMLGAQEVLELASLDPTNADAQKMRGLADRLLAQLGATDRKQITLEQIRSFRASYTAKFPNGDGVVVDTQATDPAVAAFIKDVVAVSGGTDDVSGARGASAANLTAWQDTARALVAWKQRGVDNVAAVLPFGGDTPGLVALVQDLSPKLAQFFAQCHLVGQEVAAQARMHATQEELAALDVRDPAAIDAWLGRAPLATPVAGAVLQLDGPLNPKFAGALKRLATDVLPKALAREAPVSTLTEADHATLLAFIQPYLAWRADRPLSIAEDADPAALQAALDGPLPGQLAKLVAEDAGVAEELQEFNNLERLVLYQRWLLPLANNMVSFPDLFTLDRQTLFTTGTLILDGRRLTLCVKVVDRGAHKKIAEGSLMFVAYVDLHRKDAAGGDHQQLVAAAVTAGTRGGIGVGKRGVFYDRDGVEWDATVVDVLVNPISIWEAAISPITRLRDMIAKRIEDMAGSKAAALEGEAAGMASGAAPVPGVSPTSTVAVKNEGSGMQGLLLTGSVAFAAVGTTLTYLVGTLSGMSVLDIVTILGGLVGGIMAVSGFLGWLRLRRRDISTLLEACEWALNARMRLTRPLSLVFTRAPRPPKGSEVRAAPGAWKVRLVVVALILGALGLGYYLAAHPELWQTPAEPEAAPAAPSADAAAPPAGAPTP